MLAEMNEQESLSLINKAPMRALLILSVGLTLTTRLSNK